MLEHVAVKEPVTGVVRDERDPQRLVRVHEHRVAKWASDTARFDGSEVMPVKVHPVRPRRIVHHREEDGLPETRVKEWLLRHLRKPVHGPHLASPGKVLDPHLPALEDRLAEPPHGPALHAKGRVPRSRKVSEGLHRIRGKR